MADRAPAIELGQRLIFKDETWTVVALAGTTATLQGPSGQVAAVLITHLVSAADFQVLDEPRSVPVPADSLLEGLDRAGHDRVLRLEAHLVQLDRWIAGGESGPAAADDHQDRATTVDQWVAVKARELAGTDLAVSVRQLYRLRAAYHAHGALGLVERRVRERLTGRDPLARADDRVLKSLRDAMIAQATGSTITRKTLFIRVRSALSAEHGDALQIPSDRELYRLAELLDRGRHTFGAATTRRTHDNRPDRPFTSSVLLRPGEQVQIDTNTIDILCRYADGVTRRAELTIAVDMATRSILTGVIAPSTKAVDAVAVLAQLLVPQSLRPGWPESLLLANSVLPFDRLVSIDARFELAQALPVILPDTLVCDRGSVYMADTFLRACRHLGISVQPARPYTATDKSAVERTFGSINTLFCQHVHGYVGSSVAMRGKDPAAEAVFTVAQLQDLFDEWVVAVWQNRPHESLTTIWGQGRSVSPNEAYAAMVARSGYIPIPRSATDYVELLPAEWRRINEEGITFNNRVYDTAELNPYRRTGSGITAQNGRWELHHDPYDVTQIWIRNHHHGGWITATWVHRDLVRQPFSAAIYEHVRARSAAAGEPVSDDYIARRVADMLAPERTGGSLVDKRMVARERNNPPRPTVQPSDGTGTTVTNDSSQESAGERTDTSPETVAAGRNGKDRKVVGFGVFDPANLDWGFR